MNADDGVEQDVLTLETAPLDYPYDTSRTYGTRCQARTRSAPGSNDLVPRKQPRTSNDAQPKDTVHDGEKPDQREQPVAAQITNGNRDEASA